MPQPVFPYRLLAVSLAVFLLAFVLVLNQSCKKTDFRSGLNVNPEQIESFLKTTPEAPQGVDLVIKDLRRQLYAENFVAYFLQHHGQPLWNKALMLTGTNRKTGKVNCIIPVANTSGEITAYIKCNNTKQDGFAFKAYNRDYLTRAMAQAGKTTQKYLKDLAIISYFEHVLNNKTSVKLKNGMTLRLDDTKAPVTASLAPCGGGGDGGDGGPGGPPPGGGGGWVTICNEYPCPICNGNDPNCPIGGHYTVCTTIYLGTNLIDPCGGGGGGGGGGGCTGGDCEPDPCPASNVTNPGGGGGISNNNWYVVANGLPCPGDGGDGTPTSDTLLDICPTVQALQTNDGFINLLTLLRGRALDHNDTTEHGYIYNINPNGTLAAELLTGEPGLKSIDWDVNGSIDGFMHDHFVNSLSIFSPGDIYTTCKLFNDGKLVNNTNFTLALVTSTGTSYLLKIENLTRFRQFAASVTDAPLQFYSMGYTGFYGINETNTNAENEKRFLRYLKTTEGSAGLALFKGNNTNTQWTKIGLDSAENVIEKPCN